MNNKNFNKNAHITVDWMVKYFDELNKYPVKSNIKPKDIFKKLPTIAPANASPLSP